ncbi:hypothetical protein [Dyella caseinilytica]|uniref:PH (Pleckstrin Homology) domain-containing protein n=1 Tax=Dyella caseinilytica TaxID=1849581 RepID=A0ABX7GQF0_9GAMM|nr:hypothetical protein [Dyella caseinilytica]QRN52047.1 hypothetical protein ISN74_11060 [Dyella caseinilytica]GGA15932.1 hypothetical protein GCM10011408_42330 [Dyella caseinilytica]
MSDEQRKVSKATVFKYGSLPIFSTIFLILIFSLIALSLYTGQKHGYLYGILGFLLFVPFFSTLGLFVILGYSDVIVDEAGISRRLLGWVWRSLLWSEIGLIRVINVQASGAIQERTVMAIIPIETKSGRKLRNMGFGKDVDMPGRLLNVMNRYVAKYKIPVEFKAGDSIVSADHL